MSRDQFRDQSGGGGITNFTLTVTNAFFAEQPQYTEKTGSPTLFLHWEGISDVEGHEVMDRNGFHPSWAMDPDFVTPDGGRTILEQSGKKKRLGKNYGRMVEQMDIATADLANTPNDPLEIIDPRNASTYVGFKWRIDEITYDFEGNIGKRTFLMPVEFLGRADGGAVPTAAAPAPAATAAAPAPSAGEGLVAALSALAASSANYAEFQKAALAIPGVSADSALVMKVVDQQGGFWAGRG